MAQQIATELSKDELKTCLATGTPAADIRDWQAQGFDYEEILDLCNTAAAARAAEKSGDASRMAEAQHKLQNPGNLTYPAKGVFARPKGDRDDPKGDLVCKTLWAGTQLEASTLTPEEFDLVNTLPHGTYHCKRSDGSPFKVEVAVTLDAMSRPEQRTIFFATRGGLRHNLPPMVDMLRAMHAQARVASPA
jgi:hypothetical protein